MYIFINILWVLYKYDNSIIIITCMAPRCFPTSRITTPTPTLQHYW